jgi:hypothetical protein
MIVLVPTVRCTVCNLTVGENVHIFQVVDVLEDIDEKSNGSVLMFGKRVVMIAYQFNPDRHITQIGLSVPHAFTGVISSISLV